MIFPFSLPPLCALTEMTDLPDQQSAGLRETPPVPRAAFDALAKHQQM